MKSFLAGAGTTGIALAGSLLFMGNQQGAGTFFMIAGSCLFISGLLKDA